MLLCCGIIHWLDDDLELEEFVLEFVRCFSDWI